MALQLGEHNAADENGYGTGRGKNECAKRGVRLRHSNRQRSQNNKNQHKQHDTDNNRTGGKATEILLDIQGGGIKMPKTGETVPFPFAGRDLTLTRLPSTSRAYPLSLAKKAAAYRAFFEMAGLCEKQL